MYDPEARAAKVTSLANWVFWLHTHDFTNQLVFTSEALTPCCV